MNLKVFFFLLFGLGLGAAGVWKAAGQSAQPTAMRKFQTSVFGLISGTDTGLPVRNPNGSLGSDGRNVALMAGVDVSVYSWRQFAAAVEARGAYPISKGDVVGEKSFMGGARVSYEPAGTFATPIAGFLSRFRPYGDVLYGRGEMDYQKGGYLVGNLLYTQTAGGIFAGGGGLELDVSRRSSFKADYQVEHWKTPVTSSGSVLSQQFGVGVVYRIGAYEGPR